MRKLKGFIAFCLIIGLAASVFAGGAGESSGKVIIQICHENNPGEPTYEAVEYWAKTFNERANEAGYDIEMQTFPSSQMGSKNDLIDQMLAGGSVITLADGAFYADRGVPDFGIVFAPYLFDTWEECWTLIESDWYQEQVDKLAEKGLQIISSNWKFGDRHTITKVPVNTVEDMKNLKIRVPNNEIQVKGFEVLGAVPTPMAFGEAYTALQQGTIDGLENVLPALYGARFQEVAKYLILDSHIKNFTTWICGTQFWGTLSPEVKELLITTGNEAGLYNNELYDVSYQECLDNFAAEGVTIVDPSPEVMAGFREKAEAFYSLPEFTSKWTPGLYETVKKAAAGQE